MCSVTVNEQLAAEMSIAGEVFMKDNIDQNIIRCPYLTGDIHKV